MLRHLLLRRKIFEAQVEVDKFLVDNKIDMSKNIVIQSMLFDKSVYKDKAEVLEWLEDHGFCYSRVEEIDGGFQSIEIDPAQINKLTVKVIELRRGIKASIGELVPSEISSDICFSLKNDGAVNLSEGAPHIIELCKVVTGYHNTFGEIEITQETLESMERNFHNKITGVDLSINEDHKKNEAFGWLSDVFLSFDKQTLFGQVKWNQKGIAALGEKEYRYFSPEFKFNYVHPHTDVEYGPTLVGGALTNYPFLKMDAITDLNNKQDEVSMTTEKTISLSDHQTEVIELNGKIRDFEKSESGFKKTIESLKTENVELNSKVETLKTEKESAEKESKNKILFDTGKINKAQLVALNEGKDFYEIQNLATPMNSKANGSSNPSTVVYELSEEDKAQAVKSGLTEEEYIKYNKLN